MLTQRSQRSNKDTNNSKTPKYMIKPRTFRKECSVKLYNIHTKTYTANSVIEAAERVCGGNTILAVVPNDLENTYEITADSEENALKLTNGIRIGEKDFDCTFQFNDIVVVSFMHLPAHITDDEILDKLTDKGCVIMSQVYRHVHAGTQVADGTRYVRVKFPPGMVSLSWSMKFDTGHGEKYFKVVHNNQRSLCNICQSPFHKYRQCPRLICRGCDEQGHKINECTAQKCGKCKNLPMKCFCPIKISKICPYCNTDPCDCKCESCLKPHADCRCTCDVCGRSVEECECERTDDTGMEEDDKNDDYKNDDVNVNSSDISKVEHIQVADDNKDQSIEITEDDEVNHNSRGDVINVRGGEHDRDNVNQTVAVDDQLIQKDKDSEIRHEDSDNEVVINVKGSENYKTTENNQIVVDVVVHKGIDDSCGVKEVVDMENCTGAKCQTDSPDLSLSGDAREAIEITVRPSDTENEVRCKKLDQSISSTVDNENTDGDGREFKTVRRRNKMKFTPNVTGKTKRERSRSPYVKSVKNGES